MADELTTSTASDITSDTTAGAATNAISPAPTHEHQKKNEGIALAIGVAGWLLPGLGHALQKMWGRAIACFLTVGALVFLAIGMRGNIFSSEGSDAFGMLGYVADLGTGSFYLAARALEKDGSDTAHAEGDDGTRFLAAAGVLNLLAALHAYEAARGRKA
jgi:hypothetical protein